MHSRKPLVLLQVSPTNYETIVCCVLHRRGPTNDLAELGGDLGLARAVELQLQRVDHLTAVLGRILHGVHLRTQFRRDRADVVTVDGGGVVELLQIIPALQRGGLKVVGVDYLRVLCLVDSFDLREIA